VPRYGPAPIEFSARDVVDAHAVAVVAVGRLGLTHADDGACAGDVPDRLASLALDLAHARVAERIEKLAIEGQAALDRRHDEVEMMDAAGHTEPLSSSCQRR